MKYTYSSAGAAVGVRTKAKQGATTNNTLHYLYADHLGSTSVVTNSSGGQVQQTRFLPFGGYWGTPTQTVTDRGYTGHLHNDEVGLIYMNARFYVPGIGRFASADTIVPNPTNPQAFNRYSYVKNNPLNRVDPTGHVDCGLLGDESDSAGCQTAKEKIVRPQIELNLTQKKLLALAAYVESHSDGDAQSIAIIWVALNRRAGVQPVTGGSFSSNQFIPNNRFISLIIKHNQFAIGEEMYTEPGLSELGLVSKELIGYDKDGDPVYEWKPNPNMTLEEIVDITYNHFIGDNNHYLKLVNQVLGEFNSGGADPTNGSTYYGHIKPNMLTVELEALQNAANTANVQYFYNLIGSQKLVNGAPANYLIVNNLQTSPIYKPVP